MYKYIYIYIYKDIYLSLSLSLPVSLCLAPAGFLLGAAKLGLIGALNWSQRTVWWLTCLLPERATPTPNSSNAAAVSPVEPRSLKSHLPSSRTARMGDTGLDRGMVEVFRWTPTGYQHVYEGYRLFHAGFTWCFPGFRWSRSEHQGFFYGVRAHPGIQSDESDKDCSQDAFVSNGSK